ncbi:MAG: hypothetical protein HKN47_00480 [Pirellulaceae bacterium]|nr:hypothetical protein [Pirellulaceae bacterium]
MPNAKVILTMLPLVATLIATPFSFAMWEISNEGLWPKSWPAELEPLRSQSRTLHHTGYTMYHIPFKDRDQFESVWPQLRIVATEGAPLTLARGHDRWTAVDFDAGVVIFAPNTGQAMVFKDKEITVYGPNTDASVIGDTFVKVGPPWPDDIRNESGNIPEYVVAKDNQWQPTTIDAMRADPLLSMRSQRARTEIRLIVDGKIVDLNRIELPKFIIDTRFEKKPK